MHLQSLLHSVSALVRASMHRSLMTGTPDPAVGLGCSSVAAGHSSAGATVSGGDSSGSRTLETAGSLYSYGAMNRELLDYVQKVRCTPLAIYLSTYLMFN
jgi:hypothetical protein